MKDNNKMHAYNKDKSPMVLPVLMNIVIHLKMLTEHLPLHATIFYKQECRELNKSRES